jgi:uncharacterized membrane protein YphA (DoxX/SURF4 family)
MPLSTGSPEPRKNNGEVAPHWRSSANVAHYSMGWLTILVEIFGGLAVLLGALVPLPSIPMAAVLLVAVFTVHLPYGFSSIELQAVTVAGARFGPPGFETDLLYLACVAALVLGGAQDHWRSRAADDKAQRSHVLRCKPEVPDMNACLGSWCPSRKPSCAHQNSQERSASYPAKPTLGRAREWRRRGMRCISSNLS